MKLINYFDRIYIIHLPERKDRYHALTRELMRIGVDTTVPKVKFPVVPRPDDSNGFPSPAVYSNFLSHFEILREALKDGLEQIWILEDDAIFRRQLRQKAEQENLIQQLEQNHWDIVYLGHPLTKELQGYASGLVPFSGCFNWSHCYCVRASILEKLVNYFEETLLNPPGHPRGGRLYTDAAFNLFRRFHPEVRCLVSNPNLCTQKGSPSNIAGGNWYDRNTVTKPLVTMARAVRDEVWRLGG